MNFFLWAFLYILALFFSAGMWSHAGFCCLGANKFSVVYIYDVQSVCVYRVQVAALFVLCGCLVSVSGLK